MIEQTVEIPTTAGAATTFIVHPEREGPHPVVLFLMDAGGMREELRDMARRLATAGYYVMAPNLYYRYGVLELPGLDTMAADTGGRAFELMGSLTIPAVMDDCDVLLDYADRDPAASPGRAGVVGYCMSGQYAINFAARHPERIGAAASIFGLKLVTDCEHSPHLALQRATAEFYFACAEHDPWAPMELVEALDQAAKAHGPTTEVEVFPGASHGFVFPQRAAYDKTCAERHWERLLCLFRRRIPPPT